MLPFVVLGLLLFAAHIALSRTRRTWAGAIVPAVWVVGSIVFAATGHFNEAKHVIAPAVGLVGLLGAWAEARRLRSLRESAVTA